MSFTARPCTVFTIRTHESMPSWNVLDVSTSCYQALGCSALLWFGCSAFGIFPRNLFCAVQAGICVCLFTFRVPSACGSLNSSNRCDLCLSVCLSAIQLYTASEAPPCFESDRQKIASFVCQLQEPRRNGRCGYLVCYATYSNPRLFPSPFQSKARYFERLFLFMGIFVMPADDFAFQF